MVKLGETATFYVRGERNPHVPFTDPIENRGWAVWTAVRNGVAKSKGTFSVGPAERGLGNVSGYVVELKASNKMYELWPELGRLDKDKQKAWTSEVREYLRRSGNMLCLSSNHTDNTLPIWWVRDDWNNAASVPTFRETTLSHTEKRLTPHEAGEDREPAPVTVRKLDQVAESSEAVARKETSEETDQRLDERDAKVLAILREATHPLYQKEVAERADLTQWAAGRSLRYMTAAGTIFRRTETSDERPEGTGGRFHYLYWPERQIPKRDPALYAVSNRLIDRIYRLQPGESLATRWFSSGILAEVDELVNAGVLTKTDPGTDDERIQLAEESNVTDVESVVEETTPEPVPTAQDFLSGMVDAAVSVAGRFQDAISKADPAELEREVSVPELSPQTPEETRVLLGGKTDAELAGEAQTGVYDIAVHIQRLIGQHVADATRGYQADREAAVEETQLLRRRLATAEEKLAAAERERDEIKAKYDRVREAFGS